MDVTYTLSDHVIENGRLAGSVYTCVDVVLDTTARNISNPKISPSSTFILPLKISLPNPLLNELKPLVKLKEVKINKVPIGIHRLEEANKMLQVGFSDDESADGLVDFGTHELAPGESVNIEASYVMMKECEDTEVFRSFHTTCSLTLTVIDKTKEGRIVRARPIHPGRLQPTGDDNSFRRWALSDIILPQQGIMVWWKKKPAIQIDDALQQLSSTRVGANGVDGNI